MRRLLVVIILGIYFLLSSALVAHATGEVSWVKPVIRPVYNNLSAYLTPLLGAEYTPITSSDKLIAEVTNDKGEVIVGFKIDKPYIKIISEIPISESDLFIFENLDNNEKVEFLGSTASTWEIKPGRYRVTASFSTSQMGSIKFVESESPFKGNVMYFSSEDEYPEAESFAREGGNVFLYSDIGYSKVGVTTENIPYTSSIEKEVGNPFVELGLKELPSLISLTCPNGIDYNLGEWTYLCQIPFGEGRIIAVSRSVLNLDSDLLEKFINPRISLLSDTGLWGWDNILPFLFASVLISIAGLLLFIQKKNYQQLFRQFLSIIVIVNTFIFLLLSFFYIFAILGNNDFAGGIISDIFRFVDRYKYILPQFIEKFPAYSLLGLYILCSIFIPLVILLYLKYSKTIFKRYRGYMPYFRSFLGIIFVSMVIVKSNIIPLFVNKNILELNHIVAPTSFHGSREILVKSDSFYSIKNAYLKTKSLNNGGNIYYDISTGGVTLSGLLESPNVNGKPTFFDYNIAKYQGLNDNGTVCYGENLSSYLNPFLQRVSGTFSQYVTFEKPDRPLKSVGLDFDNNFGGVEGYVYFSEDYSLKIQSEDTNRLLQKGDLTVALYSVDGFLVDYKTLWDKNQDYDSTYIQDDLVMRGKLSNPGVYYFIVLQGSFHDLENYLLGYADYSSIVGPVNIQKIELSSDIGLFRGVGGNTLLPHNQEVFFQNMDGFQLFSEGRKIDSLVLGASSESVDTVNANLKDSNTFYSLNRYSLDHVSVNIFSLDSNCKDVYIKGSTRELTLVPGQSMKVQLSSYDQNAVSINNLVIK